MNDLLSNIQSDVFNRNTLTGALVWGALFIGLAAIGAALVRRFTRRIRPHLSDDTGLLFASSFAQALSYLIAFIFYAHLIPELRALGTALLAGVGVVSVVLGIAAQNTLGNLVAGVSLVLYRPFRIGNVLQLNTPSGMTTATVEEISLGYTILRDANKLAVIVPNSIMASSVVNRVDEVDMPAEDIGLHAATLNQPPIHDPIETKSLFL